MVRDARLGTGLASTWLGQTQELYVYYIDKNDVLQEIRGKHASNSWTNGTLGQASIVASSGYSDVAADYIGVCGNSNMSYVIYHSGNGGEAQVALWTQTNDSWSRGASTFDVAPQKSFSALLQDDVWRFYGTVNSANQLSEYACGDCCNSPDLSDYQPGRFFFLITLFRASALAMFCNISNLRLYQVQAFFFAPVGIGRHF